MSPALLVDRDAVARACRRHGVRRLRMFGSATGDGFDPGRSDVDLLVDFDVRGTALFDAYFGLKEELERIFGRDVDLIMTDAVRNPYFATAAASGAEELLGDAAP